MNKKIFKDSSFIIFVAIALLYAVGNFIWWKLNTPVIPVAISALHFDDIFKDGYLYGNAPLITWIMKCIFSVFGKKYFDLQIIGVNYIFFLISLYFVYKLGLQLKDKETGNMSMFLFALTPAVYEIARTYGHQDWHVMVVMTVNIYCLIKSNDFINRKWSILYGITIGLGLLVKDEFLPYFFAPWLYVALRSLIRTVEKRKIINILMTIAIGSLISGCHYFRYKIIYKVLHEPIIETVTVFDLTSLGVTTVGVSKCILFPLLFIIFAIGFFWFLCKNKSKDKYIFILWLIVPWIIITFMPHHKKPEYCLGFVPAMILITSSFITSLRDKKKKVLSIILITIYLVQYIFLTCAKDISSLNKKIYGIYSISRQTYCLDRERIDFCIKMATCINKNSISKMAMFDNSSVSVLTGIDRFFLEATVNLYYSKTKICDYNSRNYTGCDIFLTTENGICDRDSLETALKEYRRFIYSPFETEETKKEYIDKKIKEIEQFKNFIRNNFVLIEKIPYKDTHIEVYKLIK